MARDLIRGNEAEIAPAAPPIEQPAPPVAPQRVFARRFRLAYALLAVILGAAAGGTAVLLGSGVNVEGGGSNWSAWQPQGEGTERAREIAAFVQRRYRLSSGAQLVAVIPGPPVVYPSATQNIPVKYVALQQGTSQEDVSVLPAEDSIAYILCGLGQRCAIREGPVSQERGRLVRREALELALYTFKYVDGVDSVLAYLPPRPGTTPSLALFFREDDFKSALEQPLSATLAHRERLKPEHLAGADAERVDDLVTGHLFQFSFQQAPDGSAVLVLGPPEL